MIRSICVLLLFCYFNPLQAQLCTGSLGDPIVHFTFGQGSNPGAALSSSTTNYSYVSTDCPNDGFYTVRNATSGCFGNSWHNVTADHTGNGSGYFMLVNASIQPGAFYVDTVKGLCGGMTYEFAAWVMNVILPSACGGSSTRPDLTLTIEKTDGTILRSYNTGSIPTSAVPTWNQYGSFFTTPPGITDVVLRIVNNAPGGCGNDLALDDITFRPCGPVINGSIDGIPDYDTSFCQGEDRDFLLNCTLSGGFTNPVYQWQRRIAPQANWTDIPSANSASLPISFLSTITPGLYQFRLAVAENGNIGSTSCRVYSQPFNVTINAIPVTTAVNNGPACVNGSVNLTATGGAMYNWTGPGGYIATGNPVAISNIQATQAGKYYVVVASAAGCTNKDSTTLVVNPVPVASASVDKPRICFKDSAQLGANGGVTYQWIPSTGLSDAGMANPKASPAQTTTYSVIASNSFACKDTAEITLTVVPKPVANAGPDKIIFQGQSVRLSGTVTGEISSYEWSPPDYIDDIHSLQPMVNPPADQVYTLTAVSDFGCGTAIDQVFIKVFRDIFIPTGFTPDNNGRNDYWKVLGIEALTEYKISVYNRWGERVFYTHNEPLGWDGTFKGTPAPAGIYVYVIEKGTEKTLLKGTFVLIR